MCAANTCMETKLHLWFDMHCMVPGNDVEGCNSYSKLSVSEQKTAPSMYDESVRGIIDRPGVAKFFCYWSKFAK